MSERTTIPSPENLVAHAGFIRSVARTLLLDDHEVDDVVQQTLLAAIEKPPRRAGPLKPWLATVARNLARMRRRTEGRIDRREQAAARPEATPATGEIAARLETQRKLVEAVTSLDELFRDVVVLRYFDELPPREVAKRLNIPVETVRTRTRRALEQLRGRLDQTSKGGRKAWQLALLPLAMPPMRAQAATATVAAGIIGAIGVKSILTIAAALIAAVLFLWHEASGNGETGASRASRSELASSRSGSDAEGLGGGAGSSESDSEGVLRTRKPADFVYRGVVVDENGDPVSGARVAVGDRGEFKTDSAGRFEIDGSAGERSIKVALSKDGFIPDDVFLGAWADKDDEFVLRRGAALRIRVVSPLGAPVEGAAFIATMEEVRDIEPTRRWLLWDDEKKGVSDADGIVDLGQAPPVDLTLAIDHPGFAWFHGEWKADELADGEIEVRLSVGGTVRGTVTGPDGEPVGGALVKALRRTTRTKRDGTYVLEHVVTTGPSVMAAHPEFGPAEFGSALGWDTSVPVRVADGGEVSGIDIVLGRATRVRGRLVDAQGEPVAGLKLNNALNGGMSVSGAPTSDDEGRFVAGPFKLRGPSGVWHIFQTKSQLHRIPDGLKWTIRRGETLDVGDIKVQTRPTLRGRVLTADGKPIPARAMATVYSRSSHAEVNTDGTFELQAEPGLQRIYASADGEGDAELRSKPVFVEMKSDAVEEIELRVRATVRVTGTVLDTAGEPLRYAPVVIGKADDGTQWTYGKRDRTGTNWQGEFVLFVSEPGDYRVGLPERVKNKTYRFRTDAPAQEISIGDTDVDGLKFVVPAREQKGTRVFGRVVSAATGKPVADYSLRLIKYKFFMPDHTFYYGQYARDGKFERWAEKPGTYSAHIDADGYSGITTKTFAVKGSGEIDLGTLRLPPALQVQGLVKDSNGVPVPYAQVHLLGPRGDVGGQAFSGVDGRFEIEDADVGTYNMFAVSPRHPVAIKKGVTVQHGKPNRVEIEVPDASPLTIKVRDEAGRPVEGATLVWTFPAVAPFTSNEFGGYEPPSFGANQSDNNGVIKKPYTPSAPITIRIVKDGYKTESRLIRTKKGEPITVEVVLKP
ncbi:MAG: sigma-70 family RNA polymerase sigma factor [Planctomycetota bacterium]|jgi:RNA polymerase sigma-70 factor (ECF subfamily)